MRSVARACCCLLVAGCAMAVPYEPEPVDHPMPLGVEAFQIAVGVVRDRYPRLDRADPEAFRIQSEWIPFQRGDAPGFRRATVFRDAAGQLQVVVEVYYILGGPGGPEKTEVTGDRRFEQQLAGALEAVLGRP